VTQKRKNRYVLNEREMRQIFTDLGLEGTSLVVRDADTGAESRRLAGDELRRVAELLAKLEELVRVVQRRGIDFAEFLSRRDNAGRLPLYRVIVDGEEIFFHSEADRDDYLRENKFQVADAEMAQVHGEQAPQSPQAPKTNGQPNGAGNGAKAKAGANGDAQGQRLQKNQELHEVKEMEKLFSQLEQYGLSIDDYFLTQEESVSGEKLMTRYALVNESHTHDVAGVAQLLPAIHKLGKTGIEVKRFKGLGEMNAEQLWETTLDPNARTLLRVTLEEAAEAERMFSVLMGEDVERRRQFIEEHALEVKNLDV
jgi:DNA gyrase subunit B